MKIAMFGHKRVPSREGGIEIVVEELSARMVRDGHEVVCYNRRGRAVLLAIMTWSISMQKVQRFLRGCRSCLESALL